MKPFKAWALVMDNRRLLNVYCFRSSARRARMRYEPLPPLMRRIKTIPVVVRPIVKRKRKASK